MLAQFIHPRAHLGWGDVLHGGLEPGHSRGDPWHNYSEKDLIDAYEQDRPRDTQANHHETPNRKRNQNRAGPATSRLRILPHLSFRHCRPPFRLLPSDTPSFRPGPSFFLPTEPFLAGDFYFVFLFFAVIFFIVFSASLELGTGPHDRYPRPPWNAKPSRVRRRFAPDHLRHVLF